MADFPQQDRPERKMIDVSDKGIKCAGCGADIKELPFEPDPNRKIYCKECYRKNRQQNNQQTINSKQLTILIYIQTFFNFVLFLIQNQ